MVAREPTAYTRRRRTVARGRALPDTVDLTRPDDKAPTLGASEVEMAVDPGTSGEINLALSVNEDELRPERQR